MNLYYKIVMLTPKYTTNHVIIILYHRVMAKYHSLSCIEINGMPKVYFDAL